MDNSNQPIGQGQATPPPAPMQPEPQLTPPVGPTPPIPGQPIPSAFQQPPKKKRTGLIVGIILGALALIAVIAAVLVYFLWYQNPEKVVTDSVVGAMTSRKSITEGKITVKNDDVDVQIALKASNDAPKSSFDTTVKVSGDAIGDLGEFQMKLAGAIDDDGTIYLKADGLQKIVDAAVEIYMKSFDAELESYDATTRAQDKQMFEQQMSSLIDPIVSKIDGKWLKISSSDFSDSKEVKCVMDAMADIQKDSSYMQEVGDAYREHPFIVLSDEKVDSRDGAKGYELDLNGMQGKGKDFSNALEDSKIAKKIEDCSTSSSSSYDDSDVDTDDAIENTKVRIWVDSMSHKLKEIEVTNDTDGTEVTATFKLDIGKSDDIEIPTDADNAKDVFDEIQKDFENLSGSSSYSYPSTSTSIMSGLSI